MKKGFGVNQNPLFLLLFPSLALPRSGTMGIFSDYFESPQKRFEIKSSKSMPTRKNVWNFSAIHLLFLHHWDAKIARSYSWHRSWQEKDNWELFPQVRRLSA